MFEGTIFPFGTGRCNHGRKARGLEKGGTGIKEGGSADSRGRPGIGLGGSPRSHVPGSVRRGGRFGLGLGGKVRAELLQLELHRIVLPLHELGDKCLMVGGGIRRAPPGIAGVAGTGAPKGAGAGGAGGGSGYPGPGCFGGPPEEGAAVDGAFVADLSGTLAAQEGCATEGGAHPGSRHCLGGSLALGATFCGSRGRANVRSRSGRRSAWKVKILSPSEKQMPSLSGAQSSEGGMGARISYRGGPLLLG